MPPHIEPALSEARSVSTATRCARQGGPPSLAGQPDESLRLGPGRVRGTEGRANQERGKEQRCGKEQMKLINVDNLTKVKLQRLCKKSGLNVSKNIFKVDLQLALQAYEEVKRLQAVTEEDDPEEDLELNKDENPEENPEL
ncbi:hypothetical protein NDU88_009669 [Pleurodeles waltl]|uniref:Uncharacterized protein n=1 Tax=Pleurodeles waltl TaxID=8319 RepID=A0AAV7PVM4_PLEWA|nr:hypothetical protein NDU88_009669 [Pleurodeles waltl]